MYGMNLPLHVTPSPLKPGRQLHKNDPFVFVQVEFKWQLSVLIRHSSISTKNKVPTTLT